MHDFVKESESHAGELLQRYLARNAISRSSNLTQQLTQISTAFAQLPYENLSKILRSHQTGQPKEIRRLPAEVLQDYDRYEYPACTQAFH